LKKDYGGSHITQAVLGNFPKPSFGKKRIDIAAGNSMAFGRFNPERFAVEIQVKSPGCALTAAYPIKRELLRQITVRLGLITIAKPIFPGDRYIQ